MISVNSRPTLRLLTRRFLKLNRGRNLIAVLAIVMTAVMFTSAFTGVLSVLRSTMNQDMRTSMDSSHLAIQDLTKEQFEQIRDYEKIDRMGYTVFMSTAENAKLRDSGTEIRYADRNGASSYQCLPTVGNLPKKENEAAMSTITLDLLGGASSTWKSCHPGIYAVGQKGDPDVFTEWLLGRGHSGSGADDLGVRTILLKAC